MLAAYANSSSKSSARPMDLLERVREIALQQPLATERESHGNPAFFIEKSPQFASFMDHHHGVDWIAISVISAGVYLLGGGPLPAVGAKTPVEAR